MTLVLISALVIHDTRDTSVAVRLQGRMRALQGACMATACSAAQHPRRRTGSGEPGVNHLLVAFAAILSHAVDGAQNTVSACAGRSRPCIQGTF